MAVLKAKQVKSMTEKDLESKLKDLQLELIKSSVTANKTNAKNKEIKKAIARILTLQKNKSKEVSKKA